METVIRFLNELANTGIRLSVDGEQLNCYARQGLLSKDLKDGIVRYKSQIMELLRHKERLLPEHAAVDRTSPTPTEFPLSVGEQGLYILQKISPEMSAYNVPLCFRISSTVDVGMLKKAWSRVLDRYPILTARIVEREGSLYHCVDDRCRTTIEQRELAFTSDEEMLPLLQTRAKDPFDLSRGPLTRVDLFTRQRQDSILLLTIHHVVFDGTSAVILLKALLDCYQQLRAGIEVPFSKQPSGYHEFVAWEASMLASAEGEAHARYWQKQLAGELPILEVLPGSAHSRTAGNAGETLVEDLPEALSRRIHEFSRTRGMRPSVIFLAVFQLLLHKYTQLDDIIVGMPVLGRAGQRFADAMGYFINMVPLRVRFEEQIELGEFLRKVQSTLLDALYHSSYPFPMMLDRLELDRAARNPVFQATYAYQDFIRATDFAPSADRQALNLEMVAGVFQEGDTDLGLEIFEDGTSFKAHWKYNPELHAHSALSKLSQHLCVLLDAVIRRPSLPLHEYSVITEREQRTLLDDFNRTRAEYPKDKCIHQLFAEQVANTPHATAVVFGEQALSYRQLHDQSRALALYLQSQGVGPDSLVGLCVERSLEMIVGVLGILQAGGAYMPLDPEYPLERLAYMLKDSGAAILLTQERLRDRLTAVAGEPTRLIALDQQWPQIEERARALQAGGIDLHQAVRPHHLAYVIYTSGSTGQPKGVLVEHGSVVNHNHYARKKYGITAGDIQVQVSSMSFDLFVEEVFVVLNSGAQLVLDRKDRLLAPECLQQTLRERGITALNLPTAFFHQLMASDLELGSVKTLIVGGEKLERSKARECLERWPGLKLFNTYGPTETTIISTAVQVTPELMRRHGDVCIGAPIDNTHIYVLDPHSQLQPVGVPGELYIAGDGLARGYLNRPELTQEKFVANPFVPGTRMYRTGDRARWLEDGNLEYLGRIDSQVKIRGFRVELGEIEARLRQHAQIEDAVVIARGQEAGKQLIAFYRTKGTSVAAEELKAHLQRVLPEYMLPAVFVSLATIPLTPNGKVDRRALERMEVNIESSQRFQAPRNETEQQLVTIWSQVLKLAPDRIGIEDDFFELGGHSLLATQLVAKIRSQLQIELPLKVLFERRSIAQLAQALETPASGEVPRIDPIDRTRCERLPLSFAQERLWFIDQLEPGSAAYNCPGAVRIGGELNVEQLEVAFNRIIARHENLRTVFPSEAGQARQLILQQLDFKLTRVDLSHYKSAQARDNKARQLSQAEAAAPFDLARGPLLRGQVIKLDAHEHILMINMHHIISDGWSLGILIRELGAILDASSQGRSAELAPLPIQYVDYSVWQRRWLEEGGILKRQLAYWQQQLAGVPESLDLATDHPRPSVQSLAGASRSFTLDASLTAQLETLAEREGCTLYMVLLAAFKVLLYRYTGQQDICIGSPIANRQYTETEGLIGMFVNTLALRSVIDGEQSFTGMLAAVRKTCLEAYENQDAPFEKVVDAVRPRRNLSISPLFQVLMILQNAEMSTLRLQAQPYPLKNAISKFDLTLEFTQTSQGLAGGMEYSTALYEERTIDRMIGHFINLCRAITAAPTARISELEYLDAAERQQLLVDFNATSADHSRDECLHQLFVERVAGNADEVAVKFGEQELSYRELHDRSCELALYLQSQGIGPDSLVGLCVERSLDMIVGMLGILQAGGAYVPLDPRYPDERLAYMLKDSRAAIVLTQDKLRAKLSASLAGNVQLVALDQWSQISEHAAARKARDVRLKQQVEPNHLAYVIYTSGSTGMPKGVAIEHRSAVALVHWASSVYGREELAAVLASTSICFDLSVYEIFVTLANAGTIILAANALALDDLAGKEPISLINTVPSVIEELVRLQAIPDSVQTINLAGEPLSPALVNKIYASSAVKKVYDLYGPSEDTTYSTYILRQRNAAQSIGRPISNTQVYILDAHRKLLPRGIPGELYIAGEGLARGYLNRPELTQEKFVANPFVPGTRMYRTGDRARWLEDGNLEYLGRIDSQVKIRGFRVELGEIEARLRQHAQIEDAVVIARGQDAGKQLIAFYRTKGTSVAAEELKAHLQRVLPEYMLPAVFVSLATIPLTPNGKVDRRALERMEVNLESGQRFQAPRNETEQQLVRIWSQVLKLAPDRIGIEDDFFELGGHSLLATQLVAKIRSQLQIELPLKVLFERRSIAQLALAMETPASGEVPRIDPIDRTRFERLPLSFAQERLWFIDQLEPGSAAYNCPGAVRIGGELNVEQLEAAFNRIIARHENLRTVFPSEAGQARQLILQQLDFKLTRVDLSHYNSAQARDNKARQLCQAEAAAPFDLSRGPLLRGQVIKLDAHEHILMINMHHIISDGWSLGIFIRELGAILDASSQGKSAELAPLPIQYVDYSVWQRRWLEEGGILKRQLAYWQQQLAGVPESLDLATDHPRPSVQSLAGASRSFTLDASLTEQLETLAEREGCTLYMVLLAAFKVLLYRYTGQQDICIGSPIANRQYTETEGLIGMFVNTLALRSVIDGEQSFTGMLAAIRNTCLEAYGNQDAPFEKVVDAVRPQRNLAMTPLFQVMLILQNAPAGLLQGRVEPYPLENRVSQFDLSLEFKQTSQGLAGAMEYSTALYQERTIDRMIGHFINLCRAITATPTARIGELDYLEAPEKIQLLDDFNRTRAEYPKDKCIHQLFAEQVGNTPHATAVVFGEQALSYLQLHDQSRTLALYLQSQGVGPDSLVGLCVDRSLEMIVGVLGILQAGGAYVPLDPEYPPERLAYMLKDSGAALLLTQERLRDRLTAVVSESTRLIALDQQWPQIEERVRALQASGVELHQAVRPHHLAYVIYTSGSTGQPKGVLVEHGNVVNHNHYARKKYGITSGDIQVQFSSMSFDLFVEEVFVVLNSGAQLVLDRKDRLLAPECLQQTLRERGITALNLPTAFFHQLMASDLKLGSVKTLIVGGEKLERSKARECLERWPRLKLFNTYGPTETTIISTAVQVTPELIRRHGDVCIGAPIDNTHIYVLDPHGQLQPVGVPGELYIAGDGLARGYLNRPELTQEKFVANPFVPGTRMYRTGDRARWLEDGNLEYLGRIDSQVKIRGFRVELGEIEARLRQHAHIEDAVVIARGQDAGKQLIAFYRTKGTSVAAEELKAHLQRVLPEYMLPAVFVSLATIPLTPNGKVDRRALERMEVNIESSQRFQAPRNETEQQLVTIWSQVLKLAPDRIGIEDDFFELGGHSLLATQLMAKICSNFGKLLPLATLFRAPTIAALAESIASEAAMTFDIVIPIQASGNASPVFAVPGIGGNVLSLQPLGKALGHRRRLYGLQAVGLDGAATPFGSVEQTAEANIAALKTIQTHGPYTLIGHSYGGVVAYEMARLLLQRNETIDCLILLDSVAPSVAREQSGNDDSTELLEAVDTLAKLHGIETTAEQFAIYHRVFAAAQGCYRAYRPAALPRRIAVSLYRAVETLRDMPALPRDYGWSELLRNSPRIHDIEASHFSMLEAPHVRVVAKALGRRGPGTRQQRSGKESC